MRRRAIEHAIEKSREALHAAENRSVDEGSPFGLVGDESFVLHDPQQGLNCVVGQVFALGLLLIGIAKKVPATRYASLGLLSVTLLKLFFHDLARLGQLYRIGALIVVAILFSSNYIISKWAMNAFSPMSFAYLRVVGAAVVLSAIGRIAGEGAGAPLRASLGSIPKGTSIMR